MCNFFSFVTDPINHPAVYYCFDWEYRKSHLRDDDVDSHSHICSFYYLNEDRCNKYEFNPLTKAFEIDQINSRRDDSEAAKKWANRLDFKAIADPLIIKQIVNPFEMPKVEKPTDEQIGWLKEWASVGASVTNLVWTSVGDAVRDAVGDAVGDSVWYAVGDAVRDAVWYSVWDAVRDAVWGYNSSFFNIEYKYDFLSAVKLWEAGLVPSFDGTTWRLHSGKDADVVFEWKPEGA